MDYNYYDSITDRLLDESMKREPKSIWNYWNDEKYDLILRKNRDTNQQNSNITIFYYKSIPIKQGLLLKLDNKTFLVLNQETTENSVYYRSDMIECNTTIEIYKNNTQYSIPAYAYDLTAPNPIIQSQVSILNGDMEIITQDCLTSAEMKINDTFRALGGTYKITNKYEVSGIEHFFVQRELNNPNNYYEIKITNSGNNYNVGDSFKLVTVTKFIEGTESTEILNQHINYSSSNPDIVSVDDIGNVLCLQVGNAILTAHWQERNVNAHYNVFTATVPTTPEITVKAVDGFDELWQTGTNKVFEVHIVGTQGETIPPDIYLFDDSMGNPFFSVVNIFDNRVTISSNRQTGQVEDLGFANDTYSLEKILYFEFVDAYPPEYELIISNTQTTYQIGDSFNLLCVAKDHTQIADASIISYTSSDPAIADVDSNGLVSCIADGAVAITAVWTNPQGNNLTATFALTVASNSYPIEPMLQITNLQSYYNVGDSVALDIVCSQNGEIVANPTLSFLNGLTDVTTLDTTLKELKFIKEGTARLGVYWAAVGWQYFYPTVKDPIGLPYMVMRTNNANTTRTVKLNGNIAIYCLQYDAAGNLLPPNFTYTITENSGYVTATPYISDRYVNFKVGNTSSYAGKYFTVRFTSGTDYETLRIQITN